MKRVLQAEGPHRTSVSRSETGKCALRVTSYFQVGAVEARDLAPTIVTTAAQVAAWVHDMYRRHADVKTRAPDREAQGAAAAECGQGKGRDKRLADRLRQLQAEEAKRERKRETRRKIVIGAIVRAAQMSETEISLRWLEAQIHALKRPDDRALFGLDLEPSADAAGATEVDKSEPPARRSPPGRRSCWPSSSRSIPGSRGSWASTPTSPGWKSLARRRRVC